MQPKRSPIIMNAVEHPKVKHPNALHNSTPLLLFLYWSSYSNNIRVFLLPQILLVSWINKLTEKSKYQEASEVERWDSVCGLFKFHCYHGRWKPSTWTWKGQLLCPSVLWGFHDRRRELVQLWSEEFGDTSGRLETWRKSLWKSCWWQR